MGQLLLGDCLDILPTLAADSVDSIVTDPPYGLSFMGKKWDYDVPSVDIWKECLRVLKPGGHLLAFGGTRTYHRLVVAIEDAGFEIRDQIQWIYGQGFPKSQDISKAIDKAAGAKREVIGIGKRVDGLANKAVREGGQKYHHNANMGVTEFDITAPATPEAQKWSGWGTALKPANEPICLARKPLSEKTVAKNVLKHGTGGLNIDGSKISGTPGDGRFGRAVQRKNRTPFSSGDGDLENIENIPSGRFPANVIFDEDAAKALDGQTGELKSGAVKAYKRKTDEYYSGSFPDNINEFAPNSGGASRFFYVAKASKSERGEGNTHPTVKPIKLMEYLIRLVTPEGGTVLDPFAGSGTTGIAAANLGFGFIGIERNAEYFQIAEARGCL